jgi:hypothetical protein
MVRSMGVMVERTDGPHEQAPGRLKLGHDVPDGVEGIEAEVDPLLAVHRGAGRVVQHRREDHALSDADQDVTQVRRVLEYRPPAGRGSVRAGWATRPDDLHESVDRGRDSRADVIDADRIPAESAVST